MFTAIGNLLGPVGFTFKKHSPEIYLAGAIGTGVASAVMLAKAHKKSEEVFADVLADIDEVHEYVEIYNDTQREEKEQTGHSTVTYITKSEHQRMLLPHYKELGKRGILLYGPAVLMGTSSIFLLLASHRVLKGRNRALGSALMLFQQGFSEYRKRVVDELGEEADERFYYGAESRNITTMEKDKDGKTKKTKGNKNHIPENPSPMIYQRVFDETNINWNPDNDMNEFFLRSVQKMADDQLYMRGHVMLNDVYHDLGFAQTPEGAVVGWSKAAPGDNFISFGLENDINQRPGDNRWILDFNVNGVMFEYIGE